MSVNYGWSGCWNPNTTIATNHNWSRYVCYKDSFHSSIYHFLKYVLSFYIIYKYGVFHLYDKSPRWEEWNFYVLFSFSLIYRYKILNFYKCVVWLVRTHSLSLVCVCVFVCFLKKKFIDIVPFNYLIKVQNMKKKKKKKFLQLIIYTHTHTILTTLIFEMWFWFEFPYKCFLCCF